MTLDGDPMRLDTRREPRINVYERHLKRRLLSGARHVLTLMLDNVLDALTHSELQIGMVADSSIDEEQASFQRLLKRPL